MTPGFVKLLAALPKPTRDLARAQFRVFKANPYAPSLKNHALADVGSRPHHDGSRSVRVNLRYRAIYYVRGRVNVWYWIGSHADYDNFVG